MAVALQLHADVEAEVTVSGRDAERLVDQLALGGWVTLHLDDAHVNRVNADGSMVVRVSGPLLEWTAP